jgi:hypothetical protein
MGHITSRLKKEIQSNVSIQIHASKGGDSLEVHGRGELQLGILIETMRREGFELSISPPEVLYQFDENGSKLEPIEELIIDVDSEFTGAVIDIMANRKGGMSYYYYYYCATVLLLQCKWSDPIMCGCRFDVHEAWPSSNSYRVLCSFTCPDWIACMYSPCHLPHLGAIADAHCGLCERVVGVEHHYTWQRYCKYLVPLVCAIQGSSASEPTRCFDQSGRGNNHSLCMHITHTLSDSLTLSLTHSLSLTDSLTLSL